MNKSYPMLVILISLICIPVIQGCTINKELAKEKEILENRISHQQAIIEQLGEELSVQKQQIDPLNNSGIRFSSGQNIFGLTGSLFQTDTESATEMVLSKPNILCRLNVTNKNIKTLNNFISIIRKIDNNDTFDVLQVHVFGKDSPGNIKMLENGYVQVNIQPARKILLKQYNVKTVTRLPFILQEWRTFDIAGNYQFLVYFIIYDKNQIIAKDERLAKYQFSQMPRYLLEAIAHAKIYKKTFANP